MNSVIGTIATSQSSSSNILLFLIFSIAGVVMLANYLEKSQSAVIYENYTDLAYTQWAPIIAYFVLSPKSNAIHENWMYLAIFMTCHITWVLYTCFRSNSNFLLGLLSGFIKLTLSILAPIVLAISLLAAMPSNSKKKESTLERLAIISIVVSISSAIFSYIGKGLCRNKNLVSIPQYVSSNSSINDSKLLKLLILASATIAMAYAFIWPAYQGLSLKAQPTTQPTASQQESKIKDSSPTPLEPSSSQPVEGTLEKYNNLLNELLVNFDSWTPEQKQAQVDLINQMLPSSFSDETVMNELKKASTNANAEPIMATINSVKINGDVFQIDRSFDIPKSRLTRDFDKLSDDVICSEFLTGKISHSVRLENITHTSEGLITKGDIRDYKYCSEPNTKESAMNFYKASQISEQLNTLYSHFNTMTDVQKQEVMLKINSFMPYQNTRKMSLNGNEFIEEIERNESAISPEQYAAQFKRTYCDAYKNNAVPKELKFNQKIFDLNHQLYQSLEINYDSCQ